MLKKIKFHAWWKFPNLPKRESYFKISWFPNPLESLTLIKTTLPGLSPCPMSVINEQAALQKHWGTEALSPRLRWTPTSHALVKSHSLLALVCPSTTVDRMEYMFSSIAFKFQNVLVLWFVPIKGRAVDTKLSRCLGEKNILIKYLHVRDACLFHAVVGRTEFRKVFFLFSSPFLYTAASCPPQEVSNSLCVEVAPSVKCEAECPSASQGDSVSDSITEHSLCWALSPNQGWHFLPFLSWS